jgi:hypothetical protein
MCASTYDYCGPTFTGECGADCGPNVRAGSILSGAAMPVSDEVLPDSPLPYDEEIGSGVLMSVTDTAVESSPIEAASGEEGPGIEGRGPANQEGWTAARETGRRVE